VLALTINYSILTLFRFWHEQSRLRRTTEELRAEKATIRDRMRRPTTRIHTKPLKARSSLAVKRSRF